ncbi:exo-alpha-sialidase [Candidatus Dependentiae bacterium]|nr:exo-alpha-sialidase [Candidatus Dependentiae bacterium]
MTSISGHWALLYCVTTKSRAQFSSKVNSAQIFQIFCGSPAKKCTFVQHKDIGFAQSPNLISQNCLLTETFPGYDTTLFYNSAVSPILAVNPVNEKQMVAVWQQDRFSRGGGALDITIARTSDRGANWSLSTFPFQNCNEGISARTTNPTLSYSADGKRVYLLAVPFNVKTDPNTLNQYQVVVSVSEDNGKDWSIPHPLNASTATVQNPLEQPNFFNSAITADTALPENAYAAWITVPDITSPRAILEFSRTTDGGKSWEAHRTLYDPANDTELLKLSNGTAAAVANAGLGQIRRIPNGDLVCIIGRTYPAPNATNDCFVNDAWPFQCSISDFAVVRSTDNGLTWSTIATQIATLSSPITTAPNPIHTCGYDIVNNKITAGRGTNIRTPGAFGLPITAVNPINGNLYVAWEDGRFNFPGNQLNQIALSTSRDGGVTWSKPVKVSRTPKNAPNGQAFTATLAVNGKGKVGLLYHDFRNSPAPCVNVDGSTSTLTNSWFALYKEVSLGKGSLPQAGLNFVKEISLSTKPYLIENGVPTRALNAVGQGGQGIITNADQEGLIGGRKCFYALYGQSHNGPYTPSQAVIGDPTLPGGCDLKGCLSVNNNRRVTPFFSTIVNP